MGNPQPSASVKNRPQVRCPDCDSTEIRPASTHSGMESYLSWLGFHPARCAACAKRFMARPLGLSAIMYAKCPRCYRMDLTTWDPKYYHLTLGMKFRAAIGAHRWRCDVCRCNFLSFRQRMEKYVPPSKRPK